MGVRNSADQDYVNNQAPQCGQQWLNSVEDEINNLIASADLTPTVSSVDQQGVATAIYAAGGDGYTDSGAADSYVLTSIGSKKAPDNYFLEMRVRFIAVGGNTGGPATINVATIGVVSIKDSTGTLDPPVGTILAGQEAELFFDGVNFRVPAITAASVPTATTTSLGIVELAIETEMENETTGTALVVTPNQVKNSPGVAKGWIVWEASGTVSIVNDYNISSIIDNATGDFTINHDINFANINYTYGGGGEDFDGGGDANFGRPVNGTKTTGSIQIFTIGNTTINRDFPEYTLAFHGDQ